MAQANLAETGLPTRVPGLTTTMRMAARPPNRLQRNVRCTLSVSRLRSVYALRARYDLAGTFGRWRATCPDDNVVVTARRNVGSACPAMSRRLSIARCRSRCPPPVAIKFRQTSTAIARQKRRPGAALTETRECLAPWCRSLSSWVQWPKIRRRKYADCAHRHRLP
jgi:hypothetical protein